MTNKDGKRRSRESVQLAWVDDDYDDYDNLEK